MISVLLALLAARRRGAEVLEPPETSYANEGGQGDRTALITVTENLTEGSGAAGTAQNLVNGASGLNGTASYGVGLSVPVQVGDYFRFQFGVKKYIDEATFEYAGTPSHGTWKWQGSNNGTDWVDVSDPFLWDDSQNQITTLTPAPAGYLYYQMVCASALGGNYSTIWYEELTFKIADGVV